MTVKHITMPKLSSVKTEAISALVDDLGIGKASMVIADSFSQPVDYMAVRQKINGQSTVSEIYQDIVTSRK